MKQLDPELQESIAKRFGLKANETFEVVSKKGVATLSSNITKLTNTILAVKTYEENISEINKVVAKSANIEARERQLESIPRQIAPQSSASGSLFSESDLKKLTDEFQELADLFKQRRELGLKDSDKGPGPDLRPDIDIEPDVDIPDRRNKSGNAGRLSRFARVGGFGAAAVATTGAILYGVDRFVKSTNTEARERQDEGIANFGLSGNNVDGYVINGRKVGGYKDLPEYYKNVVDGYGANSRGGTAEKARQYVASHNPDGSLKSDKAAAPKPEAEEPKQERQPSPAAVEKVMAPPPGVIPPPPKTEPPREVVKAITELPKPPKEQVTAAPVQSIRPSAGSSEYTQRMNKFVGDSVKNVEKSKSLWERMFGRSEESRQGGFTGGGQGQASGAEGSEGEMGDGSNNVPSSGSYDIKLARLLADYEGLRTSAYRDSVGIPTIGIGATYYPPGFRLQGRVQMGQTITREEAEYIKAEHVKEHRARLLREITSSEYSALPEGVKAGLESKVFNYGSLGGPLAQLTKNAIRTRNFTMVSNYFRTTLAPHNRGINAWRRNDEAQIIQTGRSGRVRGLSFGTTPNPPSGGDGSTGGASGGGAARGREASGRGAASSSGGGGPTPGRDAVNSDDINQAVRGRNIWDYARRNGSNIDWDGLKPGMKNRFLAMAIEYKQRTGNKIAINSANRSYAAQAAIYRRYGPRRAAPPGRSKHESGVAIDINSTDAATAIRLGLLTKYGFHRPYMPSETWHIEPIETTRVRGQPDNPYEPGEPIAQTGTGNRPVLQDDRGQTRPVESPRTQLGEPAAGAAILTRMQECDCPTTVIPVATGGGASQGPGPAQYLAGIRPPRQPTSQPRNPVEEYRMYFAA